jgi:hypothetical protein
MDCLPLSSIDHQRRGGRAQGLALPVRSPGKVLNRRTASTFSRLAVSISQLLWLFAAYFYNVEAMPPPDRSHSHQPPRLPLWLVSTLLPRAEAKEVRADLAAEFARRAEADGRPAARRWLWRQALHSTPFLLHWSWWRQWTGYEPRSSAFIPRQSHLMHWLSDIRYATRRLVSRPAYSLLAILTLALGVGGTAAVFGVARPLIVDDLPYANAPKLGMFWMPGWWTEEEFLYLRDKFTGYRAVGG